MFWKPLVMNVYNTSVQPPMAAHFEILPYRHIYCTVNFALHKCMAGHAHFVHNIGMCRKQHTQQ